MASYSIIENFEVQKNVGFIRKADEIKPELNSSCKYAINEDEWKERFYGYGDHLKIEFAEHITGYVTLSVRASGSHPDAPAYIRLRFVEHMMEAEEHKLNEKSWLSKGWLQEEYIHIDVFPAKIKLPRRYSLRYLLIDILDTSQKYKIEFSEISVDAVTSARWEKYVRPDFGDEMLNRIDEAGARTLRECMQDVFEDGPKRDRRLWLGDMRLQALADYKIYQNYDLVKRCLYLFAGLTFNEGKISACLFTKPEYEPDDTYLVDYALLFVPTLLEYYEASNDIDTVKDLYETAKKQIDIVLKSTGEDHLIKDGGDKFWCFLDWGDGLNKHAGANAVLIYAMNYGIKLAELLGDHDYEGVLYDHINYIKRAVKTEFWDSEKKLFVSGPNAQVSWATQIWMILADVISTSEGVELLTRVSKYPEAVRMKTPYMYHYYIMALLKCGQREMAIKTMKEYWGGMIREGADTFWEIYNPKDIRFSPYGDCSLNSYCHAWSCTPVYILRSECDSY